MQSENEKIDFTAINAQMEEGRRLVAEGRQEGIARRLQAVPEGVLQSLDQLEKLLSILSSLPREQIIASIAHLGDLGPHYRPVLEHFLGNRSFDADVRGAAATSVAAMFQESHNQEVCALLRKYLLDESEADYVRERCYFALLLVKDLPPFPPEAIGNWDVLFESFRFPQDVNWALIGDRE